MTKITVILVALEKRNHPAATGTVIMELDAVEEPVPPSPQLSQGFSEVGEVSQLPKLEQVDG